MESNANTWALALPENRADGAKGAEADGREHYTAFQAGDVWAFETPYGVSAGYMSKVSAQKRADATRRQDEERRLKAGGAL